MSRNMQSVERWATIRQNMDDVANKAVRDRNAGQAIEKLNLSPELQAAIKLYAGRAGDQVGRLLASLIEDGLNIILSEKQPSASFTSSPSKATYKLLNAADVGNALGISKSQAYHLMKRKEITCVQFGRSVRVRPEDLEEFIRNNSK